VPVSTTVTKELLADLLDEKLPRHTVREIQSAIKDRDRFDTWLELLQERVPYDDPIVLPYGEGMNIVRRLSDSELVIRTDAGADLCAWNENWKMHTVMFVRDTDETYEELYPKLGRPDPRWQELREYYCPVSWPPARDRGRPARLPRRARVPPRHRPVLPGLVAARHAVTAGPALQPLPSRNRCRHISAPGGAAGGRAARASTSSSGRRGA
jgi:acetone carboxylase gamma subunit